MTDFLTAEAGVRELYARYTDAVFRKDAGAFESLFVEAAEWRISGLIMRGRAEIVERIKLVFPNYRRILMNFRDPVVHLDEGTANSRVYVSEHSAFADGSPFAPIGTYFDRCVQEGDRWKFKWRLFQTHYAGPPDMSGSFFENPDFGPPPAMPPLDAESIDHTGVLRRQGAERKG